eukprot:jgi/Undpi1/3014/HiC_scaffold_14.g06391.m1
MLTERHNRYLERARSQRELKVKKEFMWRMRYLTVRKAELEEEVEGGESTISRIRDAMFDDLNVLLHVREDRGKCRARAQARRAVESAKYASASSSVGNFRNDAAAA